MRILKTKFLPFFAIGLAVFFCQVPSSAGAQEMAPERAIDNFDVQTVLVANQEATFSSPVSRRVSQLPFKNGDVFKKGDVLVAYDCRVDKAEYKQAAAVLKAAKATLEAKKKLKSMKSISDLDLVMAEAEYEKAHAAFKISEVKVDYCELEAPYDGRLTDVKVNLHENVKEGQEVLSIASLEKLNARMLVPSRWLAWLEIGADVTITVYETGQDYKAKIVRIGGAVDEVSQSIMVSAEVQDVDRNVLPGMTGTAVFKGE